MKIIGITGNIASGKSTISKIVANHLNVPLISVDEFSRNWIKTYDLWIISVLDDCSIQANQSNVFEILKSHLFINSTLRAIIQGQVSRYFWTYVKSLELPLLVIKHPLMFELYQQDKFDYIIGVHCGRKIRVDRMKNRGYDPRTIKQRMAAQIPFQQNARHCDLVINTTNNPTEEYVIQQLQDFTQVKTLISESSVS